MDGGGAERQLAYLASELPALGWRVHVAAARGGVNLDRLLGTGAAMHTLRVSGNADPRVLWQLARLIRTIRADIVQTWLLQMDVVAALAATCTRVPFVLTERSTHAAYADGVKVRARRHMARRAAAIVANSPGGCRYWREIEPTAPPCRVIPNGVPIEEIARVPPADLSAWGIHRERVVLCAGRFSREKNHDRMVEALTTLPTAAPWRAVLCGDGPLRDGIASQVRALGLADRVIMPGYVQDLWAWMKRADVFVSLSDFEGHPNAVLEALACGCRLVVSDIEAHRSFLDDDVAVFVDPADVDGVRRAIGDRLDLDDGHARAAAMRAGRHARRWSVRAAAERYDALYRQVLGGRSVPAVAI